MLRELGNEIIELFKDKEEKNTQIANLQSELEIKIKEANDKTLLLAEQNKEVARLQEQADLKLDEVKAIIEELRGLIVNA